METDERENFRGELCHEKVAVAIKVIRMSWGISRQFRSHSDTRMATGKKLLVADEGSSCYPCSGLRV